MNKMDVANNLFEAIDTIVDKKLKALKFDRCIMAHIRVKDDEEQKDLSKIEIEYQDQILVAVPLCPITESDYGKGAYVLIPDNDFSNTLFIIGIIS